MPLLATKELHAAMEEEMLQRKLDMVFNDDQGAAESVHIVMKQVHPDAMLREDATATIIAMLRRAVDTIVTEAANRSAIGTVISKEEMAAAVVACLGGSKMKVQQSLDGSTLDPGPNDGLAKHACSEGNRACKKAKKFLASKSSLLPNQTSAGLVFEVKLISTYLEFFKHKSNPVAADPAAMVFLTAVLEYLCAELLELTGSELVYAEKDKTEPPTRIDGLRCYDCSHLKVAVQGDDELENVFLRGRFNYTTLRGPSELRSAIARQFCESPAMQLACQRSEVEKCAGCGSGQLIGPGRVDAVTKTSFVLHFDQSQFEGAA